MRGNKQAISSTNSVADRCGGATDRFSLTVVRRWAYGEPIVHDRRRSMAESGADRGEKQHQKGKLTAQERIELFVDPGSFVETEAHVMGRSDDFGLAAKLEAGDGVVTGSALVAGRQVWLAVQDFTVMGGSLGEMHARRIANAERMAIQTGAPFIQI